MRQTTENADMEKEVRRCLGIPTRKIYRPWDGDSPLEIVVLTLVWGAILLVLTPFYLLLGKLIEWLHI